MLIREKDRALMEAVGELSKKPFVDHPVPAVLKPLVLPEQLTVMQALDRVLRLLWVGSKRFLWLLWLLRSKVDRWVRGLGLGTNKQTNKQTA